MRANLSSEISGSLSRANKSKFLFLNMKYSVTYRVFFVETCTYKKEILQENVRKFGIRVPVFESLSDIQNNIDW